MARLTRKNIKVFADSASNNGVFGSLQAGNPTVSNDVETLQSLTAWNYGWNSATMTSEKLPPLEEIQGVTYVTTYQQAYIMQEGLPEWAATVTYYKGSLVKKVTTTGFQIYNSLTDNNTNNLLSDTANWKLVMDSDNLYAYDNAVVHLAGSETITGDKTFIGDNYVKNKFWHYSTDAIAYTETPTGSNVYWGANCLDKNGDEVSAFYSVYYTSGGGFAGFNFKNHAGNTANLALRFNNSGTFYTEAPTPTDTTTTSGAQIATTGWVNSTGNNVVHLTGTETISGDKTFTGKLSYSPGASPQMDIISNTAVKGTAPSANLYETVAFFDKNGTSQTNKLGQIFVYYSTNGKISINLNAFKPQSGSTDSAYLSLEYPASGSPYAIAPASDVNNSIVTTVNKSKSGTGYYELGNGLIIQWGYNENSNGNHSGTITLPKAVTGAVRVVATSDYLYGDSPWGVNITGNTTTTFSWYQVHGRRFWWIAVGY